MVGNWPPAFPRLAGNQIFRLKTNDFQIVSRIQPRIDVYWDYESILLLGIRRAVRVADDLQAIVVSGGSIQRVRDRPLKVHQE